MINYCRISNTYTVEYTWLHIPTNISGIRTKQVYSMLEFYELMNIWNKQQPNTWKYYILNK